MRLRLEPAPPWPVRSRASSSRDSIAQRVNECAKRLGTARLEMTDRVIATGHQAWLWHPGILAKDLAMVAACRAADAAPLHLVVDQDAHEALSLTLPVVDGERLTTQTLRLASHDPTVPTGWQGPVDGDAVIECLGSLSLRERARVREGTSNARQSTVLSADPADHTSPHPGPLPEGEGVEPVDAMRERLLGAFRDLPDCRTLAEQIAVVLARLMRPTCGDLPIVLASDLVERVSRPSTSGTPVPLFEIDELLHDARACAQSYNRAVAAHPGVGIAPLVVERERVELPVWACRWNRPRRRVFADLADSSPLWTFDDGEPVDRAAYDLAPKALLLTAIMRSRVCDLFIHGSGGAGPNGYDRVTEQWWTQWRGETLAPMALATADVRLDFDVPVADRDGVTRAVWYRHHLPHNVDRVLGEPDLRKAALFNVNGAAAYDDLHRINAGLVAAHPALMRDAEDRLRRARVGVANAAVAAKRDWCFALYPPDSLQTLTERIADSFGG